MGGMLLCGLYALLGLALFCLVAIVLWVLFTKLAGAMGLTIDQRIYQIVWSIVLLIVFLIVLVHWLLGGACGMLARVPMR